MACMMCSLHGQQFVEFVSPRVATAVIAREAWGEHGGVLELVLHSPIADKTRHPVDAGFIADLTDSGLLPAKALEVLSEDDSWEILAKLQPVCIVCFHEWAREQEFE